MPKLPRILIVDTTSPRRKGATLTMAQTQITLGELIALLGSRPPEEALRFDFAHFAPSGLLSYRGYPDHLAIRYRGGKQVTVAEFLSVLKGAVGVSFDGYKGGKYSMRLSTPLWVAEYGEETGTAVVGLAGCDYQTVIATAYVG